MKNNATSTVFEVRLAVEASCFNISEGHDFDWYVLDALFGSKTKTKFLISSNLIWDDTRVSIETISDLKSFQRYNHFPAMSEISRKDALARNMMKINKVLPNEFNFTPQTWLLTNDYTSLCAYAAEAKKKLNKKTFILKPSNGMVS